MTHLISLKRLISEEIYEKAEKFLDEERILIESAKDFLIKKKFKQSFDNLNIHNSPLFKDRSQKDRTNTITSKYE